MEQVSSSGNDAGASRPDDTFASSAPAGARFVTTQWSRVLLAGSGDHAEAHAALETLCRHYWPPLYAYARRNGLAPADAEDAVQEFIILLLRRNDLSAVSPEKGRFRSFLLTALKHFLVSRVRHETALKRGGGQEMFVLDTTDAESACAAELAGDVSPERAFDRSWARTVMGRALNRLRQEHQQPKQQRLFTALQPMLMDGGRVENESELATTLGVSSGALAVAATRLRQRFRTLIEEEIRHTLADGANFAEEMAALREAWR